MAEVKWIKLTTDIFDDEKILMIESLPGADTIIVIWFKLLTLAGKSNNNGVFVMNNRIPYTDEMLAAIFRRDDKIVKLALNTFRQFGMIEIIDNVITIPNWDKHQSLDAYEKKKERDRRLQAERRAKQKALIEKSSDNRLTSCDSSSDVAVSEVDKEEDKETNKEKKESIKEKTHQTKKEFVPPTFEEVLEYAKSRGREDLAQKFFDYFEAGDWIDSKGNKVRNWKQKFITWESKNANNERGANNAEYERGATGDSQAEPTERYGENYW